MFRTLTVLFQISFRTGNILLAQTFKAEVFVRDYYQFLWDFPHPKPIPLPPPKPSTTVAFHGKSNVFLNFVFSKHLRVSSWCWYGIVGSCLSSSFLGSDFLTLFSVQHALFFHLNCLEFPMVMSRSAHSIVGRLPIRRRFANRLWDIWHRRFIGKYVAIAG